MNRILILGCSGAGKSTLANRMNSILKTKVIHLDQYYWKANWIESDKIEWKNTVQKLTEGDKWIMDGNYSSSFNTRLPGSDVIIYLDYPTWKCLWRIIKRTIKYYNTERPDMPEGCKERFDLEFLHYVLTFNLIRRKSIMKKIKAFEHSKKVAILKNDLEVEEFIKNMKVTDQLS